MNGEMLMVRASREEWDPGQNGEALELSIVKRRCVGGIMALEISVVNTGKLVDAGVAADESRAGCIQLR